MPPPYLSLPPPHTLSTEMLVPPLPYLAEASTAGIQDRGSTVELAAPGAPFSNRATNSGGKYEFTNASYALKINFAERGINSLAINGD